MYDLPSSKSLYLNHSRNILLLFRPSVRTFVVIVGASVITVALAGSVVILLVLPMQLIVILRETLLVITENLSKPQMLATQLEYLIKHQVYCC